MDGECNASHKRLNNSLVYTGQGWAYFRQKHVILTLGFLGLSYILILALFITVSSRSSTSGSEIPTELREMKNDVANITRKIKKLEKHHKKNGVDCDSEWIVFNDSCYYFTVTKSNWMKARSLCVRKGSDLAVITSEMEQKFLSPKVNNNQYWIGLGYIDEGKLTWVDGTDYNASFKFWKKGQPEETEKKNENCVRLSTDGEWTSVHCINIQNYAICEKIKQI
ncbi:hepatic lectin-like [Pelobates fuscus]|uniref:hepatic lectin-like n=1 Tax=Pelobates fuscus TaxID=191477 RepID=UPI002FE483FE